MRNPARISILACALVAAGCQGGEDVVDPGPIDELPRALTLAEQQIIRSSNVFGFDLFRRVHASETGANVFVSPLSASMALGMTMNGAAGDTWEGMRAALRMQDLAELQINESFRDLEELLVTVDPRVTLQIANSVWSRQGIPFEPAFFTALTDYFGAEARELDFGAPGAADVINQWASDATNGLIRKVLDRVEAHHIMFLLNAVYFKGQWQRPFDPDDTRSTPFTRADGTQVQVPMMSLTGLSWPYARTQDYEALELSYGGGAYAMTVVLPAQGRTLADLAASLDAPAWDALVAGLDSARLEVGLPRFRLAYETLLNRPLMDMGMARAFSSAADFTRLTPLARTDPVCIHFVKQNTFVEVNEEGTEAAAVTTVGVSVTSLPPSFIVDRPFLFVIRERFSGTVLFIGAIGDPALEEAGPGEDPPPPCQ
jgi:serpin B